MIKKFTYWLNKLNLDSPRHTKSHFDPQPFTPLSNLERLVWIGSLRRRLEASTSTSLPLESVSQPEQSESIPIPSNLYDLPPKFLELLSKGVDIQSSLLVHQLESFKILVSLSVSSHIEAKLELKLPELKPIDFISSVIHTYPSTLDRPKEELKIYTNPLSFEDQEKIVLEV